MEEITEEVGHPVKKENRIRKFFRIRTACGDRKKNVASSGPWARLDRRRGTRTLVWGMGDGKTFGSVPLGPEAAFSAESTGVTIHGAGTRPVSIGSPGAGEGNLILARKIEKGLRNQGHGFRNFVFWAIFLVGTLIVLILESAPGSLRVAGISGGSPSGGEYPLSGMNGIPPSMSSGLTCKIH